MDKPEIEFFDLEPPTELVVTDITEGDGPEATSGSTVEVHYVGVTWRELTRTIGISALFMAILAALAGLMAEAVVLLGLAPPMEAFLAFAPGGQAEMTVLAIVSGAELGYVVLHHIARILLVILGAPVLVRILAKKAGS